MATSWLVVVLSVAAALAFAGSSALKHVSAAAVPDAQNLRPGRLAAFVRASVTHRLWLAGIACDTVGLTLQVFALHAGQLAVVQPLLITGLLFALLFRRLQDKRQVSWAQLRWALVVAAALAALVALAGGTTTSSKVDRLPALIAGAAGVVVAVVCVALGRRFSPGGRAAAVLGVAVGLVYAATAALLKSLTGIAATHPADLVLSWQLYLTVALGAVGLLLNQLAFQAGPLAASLPATSSVDPLASVVVGVVVYDEQISTGGPAGIPLLALLLVLGFAVVKLARSTTDDPAPLTDDAASPVG